MAATHVPQNFFAFKGYFPFGSSKLNALQNNVRQRMLSNPLILEDHQQIIDFAWDRNWSDVNVLATWSSNIKDVLMWNAFSVRLNSTMFAHITVKGEQYMLFHPNAAYTDLTKYLARYMDYFVCGMRDGLVTVLSASDWEAVYQQTDIEYLSITLIQGSVLVDNLRRSSFVPSLPKGYFDARYLQECRQISDQFHESYLMITEVVMQKYDFDTTMELLDTPFLFDKYPEITSIEEQQSSRKTLCLLYTTQNGYYVLKNGTRKLHEEYTSTFSEYHKVFMVEGRELILDEVLRTYFGNNNYVEQLQGFIDSDVRNEVNSRIKQLLREAQQLNQTGVTALVGVHPHVKAACYLFLLELNKSPTRFAQESVKIWMNGIDMQQFTTAMSDAVQSNTGFATPVFFSYLLYGIQENSAFYTWFMTNGHLPKNRARSLVNVHRPFNVLAAPRSSMFTLHANLQEHVAAIGAYIFTMLGVRIGGFDDNKKRDVIAKSTAACIEATVAMEILFTRVGASMQWLTTMQECGLLNDCRLWIAAWLFTFKMLIDRRVTSDRIDAVLWSIKSKTLNNAHATNAEKDAAIFVRLFGLAHVAPPYILGGLMPTLSDLRRYVEKYAVESPDINFTNVYDAQPDKLHWLASDVVQSEYAPTSINYSEDVGAAVYGSVAFNEQLLHLEVTGHVLRKVFATFWNNGDVEKQFRAFASRVHRKITNLYQTDPAEYRQAVEQLSTNNKSLAFEHVPTTQKKARKLAKVIQKFTQKFQQQIDSFDSDDLLYVTWLVHSALMRNQYAEREVAHTVTTVSAFTASPPNSPGGGQHFSSVYNALINPEVRATLSMFDLGAAERVSVNPNTTASLALGVATELLDIPMSFNGKVLSKAGPASLRHVEGFPIVKRYMIDDVLARQYNSYSDLVCRYSQIDIVLELFETIINTIAVQYRDHFRLPAGAYGEVMTTARLEQLMEHIQSASFDSEGYLARDIAAVVNGTPRVLRLTTDIAVTKKTGQDNESLRHYSSLNLEDVSNQAVALVSADTEIYGNLGETSYGISHYFRYARMINADREAALLLRLLAASIHGNRSSFEFYAPINGYIHSSLAGTPTLTEHSPIRMYDLVGNHLSSRRGLSAAHHQRSNLTGYSPVIDAFTRSGGMYQLASAVERPKNCAISFSWNGREHILAATHDLAEEYGTLAGEITRIEFTAYFVRPVHKDIQDLATQQFVQSVKEQILNVNELYPVDEYAWFQFVDAVPAPTIPSTKLTAIDLSTTSTPTSKRTRNTKRRKPASKSKRRLGAAISPTDPLFERFATLKLRINTYKTLRNDTNDPNFKRDFVDFYLRAVLSNIENTEDVFIGSTADYAACVRYYGTPILEQRIAADFDVVSEFFAQPQDIKIMPSSEFPHWRVAIFQRSTNTVLVAHAHDEIDEVFSAVVADATYKSVKIPTIGDSQYNFFAMLRYIEVLLSRPHNDYRMEPLSNEDIRHVVDDLTGYFNMLDLALGVLIDPSLQSVTREPDWRHRVHVQHNLTEEDRRNLQSTDRDAYLSDNVVIWFTSWLHLSYIRDNPFPHKKFEIESPMLAQIILSGDHVIKQKSAPIAQLYLYPWFDRRRRHYYLVVVYFPLRVIFCIDSMVDRTRASLLNYAMRISQEYRSTKDLTKADWTAVVPKRVPKQQRGAQSVDFTMANIEYLVSWFMNDPSDFSESMRLIDIAKEVYTFEQVEKVREKALTFRTNLLLLSEIASQSELPASEVVDDEPQVDDNSEIVDYDDTDHPTYDDDDYDVQTTDDNIIPSLIYEQESIDNTYSDESSDHYVRVACKVIGYEISAQRHGNALRHVRYGTQSNAVFKRRERNPEHNPDEKQLSYWVLSSTRDIEAGTEIVARMPPGDVWKRFLLTGYPYEIDAHASEHTLFKSSTGLVGPTFGVGARIMPLVTNFGGNYVFGASPLPLYRPRMISE